LIGLVIDELLVVLGIEFLSALSIDLLLPLL
jgi:hypothetical protein